MANCVRLLLLSIAGLLLVTQSDAQLIPRPECWDIKEKWHGFGSSSDDNLKFVNLTTCLTLCIDNSTCVAIDWDGQNGDGHYCWPFFDSVESTGSSPTITHYKLDRSCLSTLTTSLAISSGFSLSSASSLSISSSTAPSSTTTSTTTVTASTTTPVNGTPIALPANARSHLDKAQAIRPAYIVLAGLGAGNLLLVIIAIVIICNYPIVSRTADTHKSRHEVLEAHEMSATNNGGGDVGYVGGDGGINDGYQHDSYLEEPIQDPPPHTIYNNENEINDMKRQTMGDESTMNVEENPYFNQDEAPSAHF